MPSSNDTNDSIVDQLFEEVSSTPKPPYREMRHPKIAQILFGVGCLAIIAGPIVGIIMRSKFDDSYTFTIAMSGVFGGLILVGFAKIIEYLNESTQRLRQMELVLKGDQEDRERLRQIDLAQEGKNDDHDADSQN